MSVSSTRVEDRSVGGSNSHGRKLSVEYAMQLLVKRAGLEYAKKKTAKHANVNLNFVSSVNVLNVDVYLQTEIKLFLYPRASTLRQEDRVRMTQCRSRLWRHSWRDTSASQDSVSDLR